MQFFTGPWPDRKRGAVAFSFDCDVAYAYARSPAPRLPLPRGEAVRRKSPRSLASYSRGLYGLHVGLPRIDALLERHGLRASFFVPSANLERWPATFAALAERGHELGAHGHEHEALPDLRDDPACEAAILETSIAVFQEHLKMRPQGYRSPAWDMNADSPRLLHEAGFLYDSSLFAGEAPYLLHEAAPRPLLEIPIDWSLDDAPYFLFLRPPAAMAQFHDPDSVFRIWQQDLDGIVDDGGAFVLTCHPSIIGRPHRLAIVERLIRHAQQRGDIWFATLGEIAAHVTRAWHPPSPER